MKKKEDYNGRTMTDGWALGDKRDTLRALKIGCGWMKNDKLEPGSQMRRVGERGVEDWSRELKGVGITDMQFGFHVFMTNKEDEETVVSLCKGLLVKFEAAGLKVPSIGVELPKEALADMNAFLMDGGHRHEGLDREKLEAEKAKEDVSMYEWVPVHIYK